MLYININKKSLSKDKVEEFVKVYKPMIHPYQMYHIIKRHTVYGRVNDVLIGDGNDKPARRATVAKNLNMTDNELEVYIDKLEDKILARNKTGLEYDNKIKLTELTSDPNLNALDLKFGEQFDLIDYSINKNGEKEYVDHYPINLTNLQIMDAIREAYNSAARIGTIQIQFDKKDELSLPAPNKGKRLYEGYSTTYKLTIQLWFNFDLNIIESAYPVGMNRNIKKHHPTN